MQIIKFGASWCGPCKNLAKTLASMNIQYKDIDVDLHDDLAIEYNIHNIPVLVFLNDEGTEVKRLVGAVSKETIEQVISDLT